MAQRQRDQCKVASHIQIEFQLFAPGTAVPHKGTAGRTGALFSDKTQHAVEVEAESLYEAVALTVADFREDPLLADNPGAMTEFTVAVLRNPTEHKIKLQQVAKWAEPTMREGPAGVAKRQKVRALLGGA